MILEIHALRVCGGCSDHLRARRAILHRLTSDYAGLHKIISSYIGLYRVPKGSGLYGLGNTGRIQPETGCKV